MRWLLVRDPALATAARGFDGDPGDEQAPPYRRAALHLIVCVKKEETRRRRLKQLIEYSAAGQTIPPLTRRR